MTAGDELQIILWTIFGLSTALTLLGAWRMRWMASTEDRLLGEFVAFIFGLAILICTIFAIFLGGTQ